MLFWTPVGEGWKASAKQASADSGCTRSDSAVRQKRTSIGILAIGNGSNWLFH
jgi:hypothetical protein